MSNTTLRLGWFSTGNGEGSYGLLKAALDAINSGELNARIEYVFCNREPGQMAGSDRFIEFAKSSGIPVVTLSSRRFRREHDNRPWSELREDFDRAVIDLIEPYKADITVNAGYMLIAPLLCRETTMINLHPALPGGPIGMWQNVNWELISDRAQRSGAMVHVVTEEVDGGPVLSYCGYDLHGAEIEPLWAEVEGQDVDQLKSEHGKEHPLFVALRNLSLVRERPLIVETLKAVADGRIDLANADSHEPLDLTTEVESHLLR